MRCHSGILRAMSDYVLTRSEYVILYTYQDSYDKRCLFAIPCSDALSSQDRNRQDERLHLRPNKGRFRA